LNYVFHPAAEAEHLETVAYLESKKAGLGASYLSEFETILAHVCESPQRYPVEQQPDIRRIRMKRFPYTLLYREVSGLVQLLAIAHYRRRPQYWLGRV